MIKKMPEPPIIAVILVLILLLVYGGISLLVEDVPQSVSFTEDEQNLDQEQWLRLYEQRKREQDQREQSSFYRWFEFDRK